MKTQEKIFRIFFVFAMMMIYGNFSKLVEDYQNPQTNAFPFYSRLGLPGKKRNLRRQLTHSDIQCDGQKNPDPPWTCGLYKNGCPEQCPVTVTTNDPCDKTQCCQYPRAEADPAAIPLNEWAFVKIDGDLDKQFPLGSAEVINSLGQQTDYFTFSKAQCLQINPYNPVTGLYHYVFSLHDALSSANIIDSRFTIDIHTAALSMKCSPALGEYMEYVKLKIQTTPLEVKSGGMLETYSAPFKVYCSDCLMGSTISSPTDLQVLQVIPRSSTIRAKFMFSNFVAHIDCGLIYSSRLLSTSPGASPGIDEFANPGQNTMSLPNAGVGIFRYFELTQALSDQYGEYQFFIHAQNSYGTQHTTQQVTIKIWDCGTETINEVSGTSKPLINLFEPKATSAEEIKIPITLYESSNVAECPILNIRSIVATNVQCDVAGTISAIDCSSCLGGTLGCQGQCKWLNGQCIDDPVTSIAIGVSHDAQFDVANNYWYFTALDSSVLGNFPFRIHYESFGLTFITQEVTLMIDCTATTSSILFLPFTETQNVFALAPLSSNPWPQFVFPKPLNSIPACEIDVMQSITNTNPPTNIPELDIFATDLLDGNEAIKSINKSQTGSYQFYIRVFAKTLNYKWTTNVATLNIVCGPLSTDLSLPTPADGIVQQILMDIDGNILRSKFIFQSQSSNSYCPIIQYQVSKTSGALDLEAALGPVQLVSPGNQEVDFAIPVTESKMFFILALAEGGAFLYSPQFHLEITCGITSTLITPPQILIETNGILNIELQLEELEYIYTLESFQNSNFLCPIESVDLIEVTEQPLTYLQTTSVDIPISIRLEYSPNTVYKFKVKAVAKGGAEGITNEITVIFNKLPYFVDAIDQLTIYKVQLPIEYPDTIIYKFPKVVDPEGFEPSLQITNSHDFIALNPISHELIFQITNKLQEKSYEIDVILNDQEGGSTIQSLTFQIQFIPDPIKCDQAFNLTSPIVNQIEFIKEFKINYIIRNTAFSIINNQFKEQCPVKKCEIRKLNCDDVYSGNKLVMDEGQPYAINATQYFKNGEKEKVCIYCLNEVQRFGHVVKFVNLKGYQFKPAINGTLQKVISVELGKNVTFSLPGVLKYKNTDGLLDTIILKKVKLGQLEQYTQITKPSDIYENILIFDFLIYDTRFIGKNLTIHFQLESSNGLQSDEYEFKVMVLKPFNFTNYLIDASVKEEVEQEIKEEKEEITFNTSLLWIKKTNKFWRDRSPINVNISDINNAGVVTLTFEKNVTMRPIEEINWSSLEVVILVNSNKKNQTKSQFEYFNCTEFLWYQVKLQIMFWEPLHVSHNGIDMILIRVKNESLFQLNSTTQSSTRMLEKQMKVKIDSVPKNYQIVAHIPKQLGDREFAQTYQNIVEGTKIATQSSLIIAVGTNMLVAGGVFLIWGTVNTLQMIVYLPLCEVQFPQNVVLLYSILLPMATLDIIPQEISTDVLFSMSNEEDSPSKRLEELGFETRNVILNLGSMFYFVTFLHFLIIIVWFNKSKKLKCKNKCSVAIQKYFSIKDLMNNLFIMYFEATVEVLLSMYLNLDQNIIVSKSDKFANGLGYFLMFPFFIVIPCVIVFVISKPPDELKHKNTIKKWGLIYKDLNVNSKISLFQTCLYILRRFVFIFILVNSYFKNHISLQILMLMYLNCIISFYTAAALPYQTKQRNYSELFNEITILTMTESMILYTDILEPEQQEFVGYMSITLFLLNLFINLAIVMYQACRPVYLKTGTQCYILKCKIEKLLHKAPVNNETHVVNELISKNQKKNLQKKKIQIQTSHKEKKQQKDKIDFAEQVKIINIMNLSKTVVPTDQHDERAQDIQIIENNASIDDIIKQINLHTYPSKNILELIQPHSLGLYLEMVTLRYSKTSDPQSFNQTLLIKLQNLKNEEHRIFKIDEENSARSFDSFGMKQK